MTQTCLEKNVSMNNVICYNFGIIKFYSEFVENRNFKWEDVFLGKNPI